MSGYTKLFNSIIHSTIWQQPDHVRIVWITMLAMKDRNGNVEASVPGLAKAAGKSIAETEQALDLLRAPDPYSRTKDYDGRRIEDIDGGWFILNAEKYRDEMSPEDIRAKDTARKTRWRAEHQDAAGHDGTKRDAAGQSGTKRDAAGQSGTSGTNGTCPVPSRMSRHTDTDTDLEEDGESTGGAAAAPVEAHLMRETTVKAAQEPQQFVGTVNEKSVNTGNPSQRPPPPIDQKTQNREALAKALRRAGLSASPEAVIEWGDLMVGRGGCADATEAIEGFHWIVKAAKRENAPLTYAKTAGAFADRWAAKITRWRQDEQESTLATPGSPRIDDQAQGVA